MTLLCLLLRACGGSFGGCFFAGSLALFLNGNRFFEFYGNINIFFGDKSFGVTIDHDLNPFFVFADDFKTLFAGDKGKYGTVRIFGFADFQCFGVNGCNLCSEFVYHFFGAVSDGKVVRHNVALYLTGFDLNPVTDSFNNSCSTAAVKFSDDFAVCIWFFSNIYIICCDRNTDIFIFGLRFWRCRWLCCRFRSWCGRIDRGAGSGIRIGFRGCSVCGCRLIGKGNNCLRIGSSACGLAVHILL